MSSIKIKRSQLYEKVWASPMTHLAREFGLSDRGLAKLCERNDIPLPEPGYWAKLKYGKPVKKIPLPPKDEDILVTITATEIHDENVDEAQISKADKIIAQIRKSPELIDVGKSITNPHPLINKIYKILKKTKKNERGLLCSQAYESLDIRVSKESLERALCIMDALIKSLEKYDCISIIEDKDNSTYIDILGEKVKIVIKEQCDAFEKELTARQKKGNEEYSWLYNKPQYIYKPNGKIKFRIEVDEYITGFRRQWSDGMKQRLEDCIGSIIIGLVRISVKIRSDKIEREIRHRQWEQKRQQGLEAERQRQKEKEMVKQLDDFVENWHYAQKIHRYLAAFKEGAIKQYGKLEPGSDLDRWLKWATSYANSIDPLFIP